MSVNDAYELYPDQPNTSKELVQPASPEDQQAVIHRGPTEPELEFDYRSDLENPVPGGSIYLPSATGQEVKERLSDVPQDTISDTASIADWVQVLEQGASSTVFGEGYVDAAADESREWVQSITTPTGKLMSNIPRMKHKPGTKLSGEWARRAVRNDLNLGVTFNVALWHSGFWLRLRSPTEREFLDLYQTIHSEKLSLGRATYGLIFSNVSGYIARTLLDFVVDHIHDMSLDLQDGDDVRKYIQVHDLPILYWAIACSHWSAGFQYSRPCISDPTKCNHVITEKLNLKYLQVTDKKCLTERQKAHMTKVMPKSMTLESITVYQDEFLNRMKVVKEIDYQGSKISFMLRNPTALEFIQATYDWVNAIEEAYPASLSMSDKERDRFLFNHGRATTMRQYAHYVQSISVSDQLYDDRASVAGILDDLSSVDSIRKAYMKMVSEYIDSSVVSMIAIPTFTCPKCNGHQNVGRENTKHPNWIPLAVESLFFQLLGRQIASIESR